MTVAAIPYVLAAIAAAGTAVSVKQSKASAAASKKAGEKEEAAQRSADAEMRRQRFREERVKRAQIIQAAEGTGTGVSSGVTGATDSLSVQTGSAIAFQTGQAAAAVAIGEDRQDAADSMFNSQVAGQVAGVATQGLTQTKGFKSIFS